MRVRSCVSQGIAIAAAIVAMVGLSGTSEAAAAGNYTTYNVGSVNGCWDLSSYASGTPLTLYRCHYGRESQKFYDDNGSRIRSYGADQCLDVSSYQPGAVVHLRPCDSTHLSQVWAAGSDGTIMPAMAVNMCMDLTSYNDGTPITLYPCVNGNKSQQWRHFNV
ncbi:RICIN domain-containing protein [Lentzea sp. NPDC004782]|uniref:RICIN domain-containing protein n=1 Tax=Lentzea sp. NPDC004782 TaxID=3154458 RepID=UPI00339F6DE7